LAAGQGNFPFLIDPSKTEYFTVKRDSNNDFILPDTHGFNMVAEQAYLKRNQLFLVIACMDTPDKAQVIGVRTFNQADYQPVADWLKGRFKSQGSSLPQCGL